MSDKEKLSAILLLTGVGWLSYQSFWLGVDTTSAIRFSVQEQQIVVVRGEKRWY